MDENELHVLLMLGFYRSNREIVKQTTNSGLMPGQPKILEFLSSNDGCNQKEISRGCVLDKSTVTSLLKRMEKIGLIRKEFHQDDLRCARIYLTDAGKEKAAWVRSVMRDIDGQGWQGISDEERRCFMNVFHKIIRNQKKWDELY